MQVIFPHNLDSHIELKNKGVWKVTVNNDFTVAFSKTVKVINVFECNNKFYIECSDEIIEE